MKIGILFALVTLIACSKESKEGNPCAGNDTIAKQFTNANATVKATNSIEIFIIIVQGSTDTLIPCSIPENFKQDNLQVVVSGNAYSTLQLDSSCCNFWFSITNISKR